MFLVEQNIIYWFFPELVCQHRSSVLYLQDLYIYPYSVESNGFSVGEGRVVAPTFHQKTLQRAVYPPEAQSLFHHLYVWYSLPFWAFAPIGHHPTTLLPIVVLFQPLAKLRARAEMQ